MTFRCFSSLKSHCIRVECFIFNIFCVLLESASPTPRAGSCVGCCQEHMMGWDEDWCLMSGRIKAVWGDGRLAFVPQTQHYTRLLSAVVECRCVCAADLSSPAAVCFTHTLSCANRSDSPSALCHFCHLVRRSAAKVLRGLRSSSWLASYLDPDLPKGISAGLCRCNGSRFVLAVTNIRNYSLTSVDPNAALMWSLSSR